MAIQSFDINTLSNEKFYKIPLFDPNYLADQLSKFASTVFPVIFSNQSLKILHAVLSILCIFFTFVIAYSFVRLFEVRAKERKHLEHEIEEYAQNHREEKKFSGAGGSNNAEWRQVLAHLLSANPGDWKLAVIEADTMLDGLMTELGFKGANLGERLKSADQDKFKNLTLAWEVHTIRNRIAHEGASFELSSHEAKRALAIYEQIFRDYGYI